MNWNLWKEGQTNQDTGRKPSRADLLAATGKTVPDVIARGLEVLFCGINPSLYSACVGHHFARPGNRFWPALYAAGFTDRLFRPEEDHELLKLAYGITNIVDRATAAADQLNTEEVKSGGRALQRKIRTYRPQVVAVLGIGAYRTAFDAPGTKLGKQPRRIGDALVWVLPNPSGLNAHFTPKALGEVFRGFRLELERLRDRA